MYVDTVGERDGVLVGHCPHSIRPLMATTSLRRDNYSDSVLGIPRPTAQRRQLAHCERRKWTWQHFVENERLSCRTAIKPVT